MGTFSSGLMEASVSHIDTSVTVVLVSAFGSSNDLLLFFLLPETPFPLTMLGCDMLEAAFLVLDLKTLLGGDTFIVSSTV